MMWHNVQKTTQCLSIRDQQYHITHQLNPPTIVIAVVSECVLQLKPAC